MAKRKFGFLVLSLLALALGFLTFNIGKVQAKEISNIVSDIHIWKTNYREVTPDENGVYPLSTKDSYSLQLAFDLADASSDIKDGDHFNFSIPAPLSVSDGTIELIDDQTGTAIGDGKVTSNGQGQGGNVQVTFKNIAAYLEQASAQEVKNVKGTFYVSFNVLEAVSELPITFKDVKNDDGITFKIRVDEWTGWPDNADGLSGENFAKYAGVLTNQEYNSSALGKSGSWVHPWAVRVNASRKNYSSLTLTDTIDEGSTGTQFIPETLQVQATDTGFDNSYTIMNPTVLTEGVDYTVTYSNEHKGMVINILSPGNRAFYVTYSTTSPKDGSIVGNSLNMSSPETGAVPIGDGHTDTSVSVARSSLITQGGTIQIEAGGYRPAAVSVTANKILTGRSLLEGEFDFTLTSQDGSQVYQAVNKADGTVTFEDLVFTEPGTYTYNLQEEKGSDLTVNYDTEPKAVVIEVADNGSGQLEAKVVSGPVTITNSTVPSIVSSPGAVGSDNTAVNSSSDGSGDNSNAPGSETNGSNSADGGVDSHVAAPAGISDSSSDGLSGNYAAGPDGQTAPDTNAFPVSDRSSVLPKTGDKGSHVLILGLAVISSLAAIIILKRKKTLK